ncbi:hypothetical protein BDV98DRAFT_219035 [Pterulicium gracile]|uniref:Uncharacterized protein n=1 Tax=Pterulicium gracile TaxID=1884261 RepID=A0A5C3Q8J6_9AGAR|nr:hypothetical protein BDV98DRAFT_219035 [Pterula gracilis]
MYVVSRHQKLSSSLFSGYANIARQDRLVPRSSPLASRPSRQVRKRRTIDAAVWFFCNLLFSCNVHALKTMRSELQAAG